MEAYSVRSRTLRLVELVSGVAATVLGVVLPAYALFFTPYPPGREPGAAASFLVFFAMVLTVGVSAWFDSRYYRTDAGIGLGLALLWSAAGMLWAAAVFVQLAIDPYILPSAVLALVSALAGSWAQLRLAQVR